MPYLGEILAMLLLSVVIAYVCLRLRLVPIVGFLLAGVLVGPHALGLVQDRALVGNMAEFGVILLLFTIGVELSLERLSRIRRFIVVGGGMQAGMLLLGVTLVLALLGITWSVGLFTAFLVMLSSTAIVLKLLSDRGETDSPSGQVVLGLLIFQDLAMVVMVLLVPLLSGQGGSLLALAGVVLKAVLIIALVLVLARLAIPWVLDKVAQTRGQELFLLAVVTICLGTAWITSMAGVSLALGAFLAGLVVSESRHRGYALSEILPLRTIFSALFFVSIGMLLDLRYVWTHFSLVAGVAAAVLVLKGVVTAGTVIVLGYPVRIATTAGLALAQICETSFVLERAGAAVGLTPAGLGYTGEQGFIAVTVFLMMLTPFLIQHGPRLGALLEKTPLERRRSWEQPATPATARDLEHHTIVIGYGPAGQRVVQALQAAGVPFIIVELNARSVSLMEREGLPVVYGDAGRPHILEVVGIERAKLCVVVVNDAAAAQRVVELARFMNPILQIIVRTRFLADAAIFRAAGADAIVPEEVEASIGIARHALAAYQVPEREIARLMAAVRDEAQRILQGAAPPMAFPRLPGVAEAGLRTRSVAIWPGSLAEGKTLDELALQDAYGLTVLAVQRNRHLIDQPGGPFTVQAGDHLVLSGSVDQFTRSAHLFRRDAGAAGVA